jgi:hypothetical protein
MIVVTPNQPLPPELLAAIDMASGLHADLLAIATGRMPPDALAGAPVLDRVILAKRVNPCLIAHLEGADYRTGVVRTSELWVANWQEGWVRTRKQFYRIDRTLDLKTM